jgi:hypothetical protein
MPSEEMLTSLVARTSNVRRLHRWRNLAVAAAVVLVSMGGGAAIATALQSGTPNSGPPAAVMHWKTALGNGADGIHLTVMYRQVDSGTEFKSNVIGNLPMGTVCQLQVVDAHGHVMAVGSWQYWHPSAWYPGSTWVSPASLSTFELTIDGKVVASAPA